MRILLKKHQPKKSFWGYGRACCMAFGTLCLAAGSAWGATTNISSQEEWSLKIQANNPVNIDITNSDELINTHSKFSDMPLTITGDGTPGSVALYIHGGILHQFNVSGPINLTSPNKTALVIGSEGEAPTQDGHMEIQGGGFLNVNGGVHLGGKEENGFAGGTGVLNVSGGRLFVSTDLSIGGAAELGAVGGSGIFSITNGGNVMVGRQLRLSGESSTNTGGSGHIEITGGYLSAEQFVVAPPPSPGSEVNSGLNLQGKGTTQAERAVARLGNQPMEWVFIRKPVLAFYNVFGVGNALTPPTGNEAALDLRRVRWTVGGEVRSSTFSANSLTVINMKGLAATAPTTVGILDDNRKTINQQVTPSAVTFEKGSTVFLAMDGARVGDKALLLRDDGVTTLPDVWTNSYGSSRLVNVETYGVVGNEIQATLGLHDLDTTLPGASQEARDLLAFMAKTRGVDASDDPAVSHGVRFFSRATDYRFVEDKHESTRIVDSALNAAAVAAVPETTLRASQAGELAIRSRISGTSAGTAGGAYVVNAGEVSKEGMASGSLYSSGLALWAMPSFRYDTASDVKTGNTTTGYNTTTWGVNMGIEATPDETLRGGLAVSLGLADTKSKGAFQRTTNEASFWGLSLYGGWKKENFTFSGDLGYTQVLNDIEQHFSQENMLGQNTAKMHSSAFTAGLRTDYRFTTSVADIVPHVGVRYTGLSMPSYDLENDGQSILHAKSDSQDVWTFPVGVTFEKNVALSSGWLFKPQLDLGIIPATGSLDSKRTSSIPGVLYNVTTKSEVVDPLTFDASIGLEAFRGPVSINLNYNLQASQHRTGHAVYATFNYTF